MKKLLLLVMVMATAQIAHADEEDDMFSEPVLIRTLNCTASVVKHVANVPVPDTKYDLVFNIKDYKTVITWDDGTKEDSFTAVLELASHPEGTSEALKGEFSSDGGMTDVNNERDGDPTGRNGWQGLTWYDMFTPSPTQNEYGEDVPALRLFMKSKKKQVTAKVRKYALVLSYDDNVTDGNGYSDENATCTLAK